MPNEEKKDNQGRKACGRPPDHDYTELDSAITAAVRDGANRLASILARNEVSGHANKIAKVVVKDAGEAKYWRVRSVEQVASAMVDRRLQALKRHRVLVFCSGRGDAGGWKVMR